MNKVVCLLLSAAVVSIIAGCTSAPVVENDPAGQRSRAEKAQRELGEDVSKQKSEKQGY